VLLMMLLGVVRLVSERLVDLLLMAVMVEVLFCVYIVKLLMVLKLLLCVEMVRLGS